MRRTIASVAALANWTRYVGLDCPCENLAMCDTDDDPDRMFRARR